jgi:hypothetical protein
VVPPGEQQTKKQGQFTAADVTDTVAIPDRVRYWQRPCSDFVVTVRLDFAKAQPIPGRAKTQGHGPWEKYWKPVDEGKSTLVFDSQTKKWSIPMTLPPLPPGAKLESESCDYFASQLSFQDNVKPEELFTTLKDQVLRPRPKFSVWESLSLSNRRSSIIGLACFTAGLFSLGWLLRSVRRVARERSQQIA